MVLAIVVWISNVVFAIGLTVYTVTEPTPGRWYATCAYWIFVLFCTWVQRKEMLYEITKNDS
jgi:hypothetical protein